MRFTLNESAVTLERDLVKFEQGVEALVKVPLTQNQFDVLVSFAFNCGLGALQKSTLLKKVNAQDFDAVPTELMKWTRAGGGAVPGLVRRRRAEAKMWRSLNTAAPLGDDARLTPDKPKASKPITRSKEANAAVAAGGLGTIAILEEIVPLVKDGRDLLTNTPVSVLLLFGVVLAAGAIWYWRKKRLDEEAA